MRKISSLFLFFVFCSLSAQCIPNFGAATHFAMFSVNGAVSSTGISNITGDIGTNVGAVYGFELPTILNGTAFVSNAHTASAATNVIAAYNELSSAVATNSLHTPAFGDGETLGTGVYAIGAAGSVAGNLILDAQGNPDAIFIFKIGGAFTTGAGTNVILINDANPANIFWVVEGAIAMAASTTMSGTLISNNGAVSMGDQSILHGRLFSTTGAVSVYGTTIDVTSSEMVVAIGGSVVNQAICSGTQPNDLLLTDNSGTVVKWQLSTDSSFATATDIVNTSTTLTGASIGNLSTTTYFRAQVQKIGCVTTFDFSLPSTITISSTTWNGIAWSNGNPSVSKSATISGNYTSSGDIEACALNITNRATVIIPGGNSVILSAALSVDSDSHLILENNANLIQSAEDQNRGTITVEKTTAELKRLDYILWSSPVSEQFLQSFSPATLPNRFYTYSPLSNQYVVVPLPATTYFIAGASLLIRLPNTHPINQTEWNASFSGIPNNGTVSLDVLPNKYYAVGNPYPSGINATMFIAQNNITEPLYFWRKTNNANNSSYAAYTTAGGISNSVSDPLDLAPGVIIPVGQGFIAKAANSSLTFTNQMRLAAITSPLLRTIDETSRIWLNITNPDGFFGQQLIAYMPEATFGIDNAIDGRYFNDSQTAFTSIIADEEFSIQGRPAPFVTSDIVNLGFKSEMETSYTISISHTNGLFNGEQAIFLKDKTVNILTNLKEGSYTFSTAAGIFNNRFELVYQNLLAIKPHHFDAASVAIYKQNSDLVINAGQTGIANIKVFDVSGRLLIERNNVAASETRITMTEASQVLIVKITSNNFETVSKKVIY